METLAEMGGVFPGEGLLFVSPSLYMIQKTGDETGIIQLCRERCNVVILLKQMHSIILLSIKYVKNSRRP